MDFKREKFKIKIQQFGPGTPTIDGELPIAPG
jgi:hypothetical protein